MGRGEDEQHQGAQGPRPHQEHPHQAPTAPATGRSDSSGAPPQHTPAPVTSASAATAPQDSDSTSPQGKGHDRSDHDGDHGRDRNSRKDSRRARRGKSRRATGSHGPQGPRRTWRGYTPEELAARRQAVPTIVYPDQLPVSARREEIAEAIADNQVVIVAGETGSGKTTQLPKICLELGRGVSGMIGHTQPRRIAARSVAERIAQNWEPPPAATGWSDTRCASPRRPARAPWSNS